MREYHWATLGCGVIANQLAQAMEQKGRTLYSVANRMCLEFTRDVMDIMTEIRDSWGLKYPEEERKES